MMKTFTSHWFSGLWTMVVMALSVMITIYTEDATHVARAGALVTLAGIFMTTRRLLVNSAEKSLSSDALDQDPITLTGSVKREVDAEEEIEHLKAEKCGFWFLIVGTVIWAYGDLVITALLGWS